MGSQSAKVSPNAQLLSNDLGWKKPPLSRPIFYLIEPLRQALDMTVIEDLPDD